MDSQTRRFIEVASAYYLEYKTQAEIARSLGISRSMVSRYLTSARELGLVQIHIASLGTQDNDLRQIALEAFPHLQEVVIAPTHGNAPDALRSMIGRFAANYLKRILRTGMRVAIGCGHTLHAMAAALKTVDVVNISVVQAMGNIGHEAHSLDYNEIARAVAIALHAKLYYVSAPAILGVNSGSAQALVNANPTLLHALNLARTADIIVVGIGSIDSDMLYVRSGLIQEEELNAVRHNAVGDICGRFFNIDGVPQPSPFEDRIVGVDLDDLRRARFAIGVAGCEDKVQPILGALRGGFINTLITDEITLRNILEQR